MALTPLGVLLRAPSSGAAKTRLAEAVGQNAARDLYRAFVADTLDAANRADCFDITLFCDGEPDDDIRRWANNLGAVVKRQPDGQFGQRVRAVVADGVGRAGRGLVIGTDAPTLPTQLLIAAKDALEDSELVLGPAADGGYYLVGARTDSVSFEDIRWSTSHALQDTLIANRALKTELLPPWYDIDVGDDLRVLRAHMALDSRIATHTRASLF